ncbi:MAG: hypothetical protein N4A44_00045 [Alphaproteobacteria bacterium]|nr:hypothetical protein [Alphaproteobacteria bacterium]
MKKQLQKFQQGRSMIEMLGVLGIMAVITVLAITAYKMAYRNSKMNELKQELGSINQQIDQSYANQKFQDEGVVLGEDRTFENMFVDTKMLKSAVTPFGGTYSISAVSNDLFEVKLNGLEEDECLYVIQDDALLKKTEKMTISCVDINGLEHFTSNNINNPDYSGGNGGSSEEPGGGDTGGNTGGDTGGSEKPEEPYIPSEEMKDYLSELNDYELSALCTGSDNDAICKVWLDGNPESNDLEIACSETKRSDICNAFIESNPDSWALQRSCSDTKLKAACDAYVETNPEIWDLQMACGMSGNDNVCKALLESPDMNESYLGEVCGQSNNTAVCDEYFATNPSPEELQQPCASGSDRACEELFNSEVPIEDTRLLASACNNGVKAACDAYMETNPTDTRELHTACITGGSAEACDKMLENLDKDNYNYDWYLSSSCYSGNSQASCDKLLDEKNDGYTYAETCRQTGDADVCNKAFEISTQEEGNWDGYLCHNSGMAQACKRNCEMYGNKSACAAEVLINEGGWNK